MKQQLPTLSQPQSQIKTMASYLNRKLDNMILQHTAIQSRETVFESFRFDRFGLYLTMFFVVFFAAFPLSAQQDENDATALPWDREPQNKMPQVTEPSERELLVDVSEEEKLSIRDHLPIKTNPKLFTKFLFRVSRFGLNNLNRLAKKNSDVAISDLETDTGFHRFKIMDVSGVTQSWEARELIPSIGELYDLSIYYKIKLKTNDGQNVVVYSLAIPNAWKKSTNINEEVRFQGLFMNLTLSKEKMSIMNFITDRVQWFPQSKSDLVTSVGPALLSSAGFDLGLLDVLEQRNRRRLDSDDTESFYQMLAAAKKINGSEELRKSNIPVDWEKEIPEFNLIQHLKTPQDFHGTLSRIAMEVRNVTRVKVDAEYIGDRIGIDEYFQLDGFIKFDSSVTYKAEEGNKGAVFKDKYPISVCLNQLPKGWTVGSGQNYRATFPVFFFKIWSFPTGFQSKFSAEALQQSPLFVGLNPITFEIGSNQGFSWTTAIWFSLIGVGIISIWTSYYLAMAKKDRSASRFQLPKQVEIEDLETEDQPKEKAEGMPVIRE